MTEGFIDSASAYEVIFVFARNYPGNSYRMEWDRALEVTATLINTDHVKLAPSPRQEGPASGPYGIFLEGLESAVSRIVLPDASHKPALIKTRNWANKNIDKLRAVLKTFTDTSGPGASDEPARWLQTHISYEWKEHLTRHGHESRVALWVENVVKLRNVRHLINLDPKDRDETARDAAIDAARRFGIRTHPKALENFLDAGIGFGSTALTSFMLVPWESMAVGSALYLLSARSRLGDQIARTLSATRMRLRRLSELEPGRIDRGTS